jgi:hypothetical protein
LVEEDFRPDRPVSDALTTLRKQGLVKWEEINDETRDVDTYEGKATIKDALIARLSSCRLDFWDGAAPLIITESRSLRGALTPVASRTNGQCAGHLHTEVAAVFRSAGRRVLYFGDWDFSGGHIEANAKNVLEAELGLPLNWYRIGLTEAQVKKFHLPVIRKKKYPI